MSQSFVRESAKHGLWICVFFFLTFHIWTDGIVCVMNWSVAVIFSTTSDLRTSVVNFWSLATWTFTNKHSSIQMMKSVVFVKIYTSKVLGFAVWITRTYHEFANETLLKNNFGVCEESPPKRHLRGGWLFYLMKTQRIHSYLIYDVFTQ